MSKNHSNLQESKNKWNRSKFCKEKVKLTITFYNVQDFNQKWGISVYKNKQRRDYKIGGQTMLKIKYHLLNFL